MRGKVAALIVACACLSGCSSVGDVSGAVAGLVTGAISANPAVGIAVGVSVRAAAAEGARRVSLARQRNEQDAIADAIADAEVGEKRTWAVDQYVTGDAHGEVHVVRLIETPFTVCKELLFSVVSGEGAAPAWFATTACDDGGRWKWAAAEPAVERWGNLQ